MDASVSTEKEVSQLPLLDEGPPSDAKVAADRVEAVLDPFSRKSLSDLSSTTGLARAELALDEARELEPRKPL